MSERQALLERLELAVLKRICERLEDPEEQATPAYLDVARKILEGRPPLPPPIAPPVTENLPFPIPEP